MTYYGQFRRNCDFRNVELFYEISSYPLWDYAAIMVLEEHFLKAFFY